MGTAAATGLNGLSYAFILFLLAAGFSLTFGVMGILNMAHGSLYMIGAYFGFTVLSRLNIFALAIVMAAIGIGIIGLVLECAFLGHLYKKIPEQAVLTIALSYAFANIVLWIWGPFAQMGKTPELFSGSIAMGNVTFPVYRLVIIGVGLVVLAALLVVAGQNPRRSHHPIGNG